MNYNNARIYKIHNNVDKDVYVGSTCQELSKRMAHHRKAVDDPRKQNRNLYVKMKQLGVEHFYIELIEKYPCTDKEQLRKREGHFIREMGNLNMCIAGRNMTEYRKETKEHIIEQSKDYYQRTKEYQLERQKSDKVKAWKNERNDCLCGGSYTNCHKAEHLKSDKHMKYLLTN